jgi:hypothetical protein
MKAQRAPERMTPGPVPVFKGWLRLNKKISFLSGADGAVGFQTKIKERYASI